MAAGAGYIDAQGIHIYGEDDEGLQPSEMLNLGMRSVSAAIAADRSLLDVLSGYVAGLRGEDGWATAFQNTAAWGTRLRLRYRTLDHRVYIEGYATLTIAGTGIFTLPVGSRPKDQMRTLCTVSGENILIEPAGFVNFETARPVGSAIGIKFDFPKTW